MTKSTDILNGKETFLGYAIRNRKFIIIALIGIVAVFLLMKISWRK